jgi:hypothetical protein
VAHDAPLNNRQIDVLRWISEGCLEGRWPDFTYKTTAAALEWRGLVTISKRDGWTAAILPAGTHYLKTDNYPAGHRLHRVRPPRLPAIARAAVTPPRTPRPSTPAVVKPTYQLVKDVVEAGGVLERDITDDTTNYKHLVAIINGRQIAPEQQIIINDWAKPGHVVLRLSNTHRNWRSRCPNA